MPRIPDDVLNCVVYLYPTAEDAKLGENTGGSGFLVYIPFERQVNNKPIRSHVYAVTNSHVVRQARGCGQSPVIRLTTKQGNIEPLGYTIAQWLDDNLNDDLAVCYIDDRMVDKIMNENGISLIPLEMYLTYERMAQYNIGIGTDTVAIGRFIYFEDQKNTPILRFGNIATTETVQVRHEQRTTPAKTVEQESWLVESHSQGGFSGSPVFTCILHPERVEITGLFGIDWGHLPRYDNVVDKSNNKHSDGLRVSANSGMMTVIPAWKLKDFLYREDVVKHRKEVEAETVIDDRYINAGAIIDAELPVE